MRPPDRFVAGEESALTRWVDARQSLPSFRPDKGTALRIGRKGALVHNAETLAHVAMIARTGPDAFRARGLVEDPGSTLITISGAVEHPGVVEVDRGTPLIDIVNRATPIGPPQALLVGGYGGAWVGPAHFTTPYASLSLRAIGAAAGVGIVIALGQEACGLMESARIAHYMAGESAGQCGPCVYGLPAIADDLTRLARGEVDPGLRARLDRRLARGDGPGCLPAPRRRGQSGAQCARRVRRRCERACPPCAVRPLERQIAAPFPANRRGGTAMIRILVDPVACDAYGYCAELLPEAISLDEWGYPIVDGKPLPPTSSEAAKRAARDCPRRAITVRERKGGH